MSLPLRKVKEKLEGSDLEIKFEKHLDPDETREFFLRVGGQATSSRCTARIPRPYCTTPASESGGRPVTLLSEAHSMSQAPHRF